MRRPQHRCARHGSGSQRGRELAGTQQAQRHLDVHPGLKAGDGVVGAEDPVARHESREAPLVAQHIGEQGAVHVHVLAPDPVVRGHQGVGAGIHGGFEVRQVHLMQRVLVHVHVDLEALVLHRVEREVLHARHHVHAHAPGHGRPHPAGEHRILAVALLRPSPRGVAQQIHAHGRGVVRALGPRLDTDGEADLLLKRRVPGRRARHRDRESGGGPDHHAAGAVAEPDPRDAEARDGAGHERPPTEQPRNECQKPSGGVAVEQREELGVGHQLDQSRRGRIPVELTCANRPHCRVVLGSVGRHCTHRPVTGATAARVCERTDSRNAGISMR